MPRRSLPTTSGGLVTLAGASAGEWLEHANESVREAAYRVYYGDAASTDGGAREQERALLELLAHRHRLSSLAGFSSFAERSVRATMAEGRGTRPVCRSGSYVPNDTILVPPVQYSTLDIM